MLKSGKLVTGMIVEEDPKTVNVIVDPLASDKPVVVDKSAVLVRQKAENSIMPEGLLNRLSREELLDLIAFVFSRGNDKHRIYQNGQEVGGCPH